MRYTIANDGFTLAADTLGAQLVSLKNRAGFEHIWTGDPAWWTGQAPVLFPMVGALREGRARLGEGWIEMGQHGFARRTEFALAAQTADSLRFVLEDSEKTRACYPFAFRLEVAYTLTPEGCRTDFTVENTGGTPMPFAIGGHPGYNVPVGEADACFTDYVIRFAQPERQRCPAIVMGKGLIDPQETAYVLEGQEIPLSHELFYRDALVFEDLNSSRVSVLNPATGRGLEMDFSGFPLFGIWSAKNDGPYVCLEPWTGCATRTDEGDDFAAKHRMISLPAGERYSVGFSVRFF